MAHKCKNDWDSWINPKSFPPTIDPNDGVITIGTVTSGKFKGKHRDKTGKEHTKLKGDCEEKPHHYISFTSDEDGVIHLYEGAIQTISGKTWIRGTHSIVVLKERDGKRALDDGDDDWVGTQTT